MASLSPIIDKEGMNCLPKISNSLTEDALQSSNLLADIEPSEGKTITGIFSYRGKILEDEIIEQIKEAMNRSKHLYQDYYYRLDSRWSRFLSLFYT